MSERNAPTVGTILFILFGPLVWAGHLLVVYGGHASLCAFELVSIWGLPVVPVLLWGTTAGALALLALGLLWPRPLRRLLRVESDLQSEERWMERLMRLLTLLSLLAVIYAGIAVFMVPYCLQLR